MRILYFLCILCLLTSCHKMDVGYLETDAAKYDPNELTVKKEPDPSVDWAQTDYGSNWVSAPLSGIDGTCPIRIEIFSVTSPDGGEVPAFLQQTDVRGDGTFDIPLNNTIPLGRYVVTLRVSNKDHEQILKDIFTVVVCQK